MTQLAAQSKIAPKPGLTGPQRYSHDFGLRGGSGAVRRSRSSFAPMESRLAWAADVVRVRVPIARLR